MAKTKAELKDRIHQNLESLRQVAGLSKPEVKEGIWARLRGRNKYHVSPIMASLVEDMGELIALQEQDVRDITNLKEMAEEDYKKMSGIAMKVQERCNIMEMEKRVRDGKEFNLNFTAIKGHVPILWIKAITGTIDAGQFGKLRGAIMRQCPGVELILLTNGNSELYELEEEELNAMGLARIIGRLPEKAEPIEPVLEYKPALPDKTAGGEGGQPQS